MDLIEVRLLVDQIRAIADRCRHLTTEAVQGAALALQSIDHVHGGDGLPLGVFGVSHSVADHVLKEHLQHAAGLLVDETGDTLHTTTTSQTTDGRLRDALDVIAKHLAVTLGASLSQSLASLAASSHLESNTKSDAPLKNFHTYMRDGRTCEYQGHTLYHFPFFSQRLTLIYLHHLFHVTLIIPYDSITFLYKAGQKAKKLKNLSGSERDM